MTEINHQLRLANRPVGLPTATTWAHTSEPIPEPGDGEFRVEVAYASVDPAMRGWLNDGPSYVPPVGIGEVMRAHAAGRITASRHPDYAVGELVTGLFGIQEHAISDGRGIVRVDPAVGRLPTWLGALGMPGMTAYFGLLDVGRAREGDTVVVSGAAGAVGSLVGQIAKRKGCRTVGIAGGPAKCAWLVDELGFDAAIDYKHESVLKGLREHAPKGIDVYFDNVGGEILDDALAHLRRGARVVICGAISQYNATEGVTGPRRYLSLLVNRASMTGMVVFDFADRYGEAAAELTGWLRDGSLVAREQIAPGGVNGFPDALLMLFTGANTGKLVLEIGGEPA